MRSDSAPRPPASAKSRRIRRGVITGIVVALLAVVGYGIWNAGSDLPPGMPTSKGPISFGGGIVRGERINGHSWSIAYDHITTDATQTMLQVDGVRNGLIYVKNKPSLRFTADHAAINTQSNDFSANGHVHVETVDTKHPRAFDTDALVWTQLVEKLAFPHAVTIRSRSSAPLHAGSVTIDVTTKEIHIENLQGSFSP